MVENRKLFYAISVLLLLSCCQIITMFPHNADSEMMLLSAGHGGSESGNKNRTNTGTAADTSNNSEYNRANVDRASNQSYGNNNNDDDSEFIIAVERMNNQQQHHHQTMEKPIDESSNMASMDNQGVWEAPDTESSENIDDLIFLDKGTINQHQYFSRLPPCLLVQGMFAIHRHLSADGTDNDSSSSTSDEHTDSLTHITCAPPTASTKDIHDVPANTDGDAALPPHEIQLQPDNNEEVSGTLTMATMVTTTAVPFTPLDLSDFLSLIPVAKLKAIEARYRNDPEVQRAHAFMSSPDFISMEQHIISTPEMSAFLRYLNSSGFDLLQFMATLNNLTTTVESDTAEPTEKGQTALNVGSSSALETNDIDYGLTQKPITTTSTIEIPTHPIQPPPSPPPAATTSEFTPQSTLVTSVPTTPTSDIPETTTAAKEQLNGLHGLVDSILDALPQDQILATFFDKLESSEQFSKFVDRIGSPEFARILHNMQNSVPLRNLIFNLHNNGVYVTRIVDSIKSYFFLGGF